MPRLLERFAFVCGRPGTCAASTQLLLLSSIARASVLSSHGRCAEGQNDFFSGGVQAKRGENFNFGFGIDLAINLEIETGGTGNARLRKSEGALG